MELGDFKLHPVKGIATTSYNIYIRMPRRYVINPQPNYGIHAHAFTSTPIQQAALFAHRINIEKVNKTSVVINFTVAEPYLRKFQNNLMKAEHIKLIKEQ